MDGQGYEGKMRTLLDDAFLYSEMTKLRDDACSTRVMRQEVGFIVSASRDALRLVGSPEARTMETRTMSRRSHRDTLHHTAWLNIPSVLPERELHDEMVDIRCLEDDSLQVLERVRFVRRDGEMIAATIEEERDVRNRRPRFARSITDSGDLW